MLSIETDFIRSESNFLCSRDTKTERKCLPRRFPMQMITTLTEVYWPNAKEL